MRRINGYTHFDFLRSDFMASQYFLLLDLLTFEALEEQKAMRKANKK